MTAFADLGRYKTAFIKTPPAETILAAVRAGSSYSDLGVAYGCSESTLRRRVQESGLVAKRRHGAQSIMPLVEDLPAWMDQGLCGETDPAIFYVDKGHSPREAKAVCGKCSVRAECLAYALAHDERWGVWGGTTEKERRRMKKEKP